MFGKKLLGKTLRFFNPDRLSLNPVVRLELLRHFTEAAEPRTRIPEKWLPIWQEKIGADPRKIIERLIRSGDLISASPVEAVLSSHSLPQIKAIAKTLGLSSSGTKRALAESIEAADPKWCSEVQQSANLFICSQKAKNDVLKYQQTIKGIQTAAQSETLDLVRGKKFKQANKVLSDFECKQFFPRGIGIDWSTIDFTEELDGIFSANPGFHIARWSGVSDDVRNLAAMNCLWGGESNFRELIDKIIEEGDLDQKIMSARMLNSFVSNRQAVRRAVRSGMDCDAEILAPNDNRTCSVCMKYNGRRFPLGMVPEVPLIECRCDDDAGCRCTISIVLNLSELL
jgi:hypothetical protein